MAVTPDTIISILKVPIEIDNLNQLTFANATAQYNYFNGCTKKTEEDLYYQRKDNYIAWPDHIDNIIEYNYVMYQNTNYSNKWFYAFITRMEYENDGMTRIYIETDTFQSWQFDIIYKASFVEREHVNDDTIGKNIIEENLQLGEYVCNKKNSAFHTSVDDTTTADSDLAVVLGVTELLNVDTWVAGQGTLHNGIYTGLRYYAFNNYTNDSTHGIPALNDMIEYYSRQGKLEEVNCLFYYPSVLSPVSDALARNDHIVPGDDSVDTFHINHPTAVSSNKTIDFSQSTIDGYTPKNNKLFTGQFNYLLVSNNNGGNVTYRYEDFYTVTNNVKTITTPRFDIHSCLTPGGSIRMNPINFKGVAVNQVEGINLGKFPVCNWTSDVYTNWLTQNGVNIALNVAGSTISGVTGAITGNPIGVASGIMGVANTLGEIYKESLVPYQATGNINCGDVVTAEGSNDFIFYNMSIKADRAKIIDNFFSMYGYKVNELKTPNVTGRTYWNYVKTVNCNLEGNIPQEDLQKIKDMFNNGVTFWHDASKFLDYTQNNTIVT